MIGNQDLADSLKEIVASPSKNSFAIKRKKKMAQNSSLKNIETIYYVKNYFFVDCN
jgi:hypothetical protein